MKKVIRIIGILMTMLLAGCSAKFEPTVTSLYVEKDGGVKQAIVESFEKDYYSLREFQGMLDKEVAAFNKKYGQDKISVDSVELKEGSIYLILNYTDYKSFSDYDESFCFIGSISDALDEGLGFNMVFKDKDYKECSAAEVTADKKLNVVVLDQERFVQLQKPVKYVSNNVEIIDEHMVQIMVIDDPDEKAYIVY